jgi:PAS domain S-box-containing protein
VQFFGNLFDTGSVSRGLSSLAPSGVLWLNVISDVLIAFSYYGISLALLHFFRKRPQVASGWLILLGSAFIFACGTSHLVEAWTVWEPKYRLAGFVKAITAAGAVMTSASMWRFMPVALTLLPKQGAAANWRRENEAGEPNAEGFFGAKRSWAQPFDAIPDQVSIVDLNGKILQANKTMRDRFEPIHGNLIGLDYRLCYSGTDNPEPQTPCAAVLSGAPAVVAEGKLRTLEGWFRVSAYPLADENGMLWGAVSLVQDVTSRKQGEDELRASELKFRSVAESVADGIISFDLNSNILFWNRAAETIFGYKQEEALGKSLTLIVPERFREVHRAGMTRYRDTGEAQLLGKNLELVGLRKDGSEFPMELSISTWIVNEGEFCTGIVRDITRRKQAEDALRESEMRFRTMFEQTTVGMSVISPDGVFQQVNPSLCKFLGYTEDDLIGHSTTEFTHPADIDRTVNEFREAKPIDFEKRYLRQDGSVIWGRISAIMHSGPAGERLYFVALVQDISQRKAAEMELRKAHSELELRVLERTEELSIARTEADRANAAKSEFLSRMSHELRTPLNAILGFTQLLQIDEEDPEAADSIDQILTAGHHLLSLINEVLDISGIEAGRLSLSIEPVAICEALAEALSLVRPTAERHHVTLEELRCEGLVLADRQRLKQVLLNLLSNAIKYNCAGGRVKLTVEETWRGCLRLSVRDTGLGISAEDAEKVFIPFERLNTAKTEVEGLGLGLAITKQLVDVMGGSIGFESQIGEGSVFWIELPLAKKQAAPVEQPSRSEHKPSANHAGTLLYIEDNKSNLKLLARLLARRPQIRLLTAARAELGIEVARCEQPDLILLDFHLPDFDGSEALGRLMADVDTASIPVVMISGDASSEQAKRMIAAGARDYLTKPLDVRTLLATIDKALDDRLSAR